MCKALHTSTRDCVWMIPSINTNPDSIAHVSNPSVPVAAWEQREEKSPKFLA